MRSLFAAFEVTMQESRGRRGSRCPSLCRQPQIQPTDIEMHWGRAQFGLYMPERPQGVKPLAYAMPNRIPANELKPVIRGLYESPLLVAAITLYRGSAHPFRHLPRRTYRVQVPGRQSGEESRVTRQARIERLQ